MCFNVVPVELAAHAVACEEVGEIVLEDCGSYFEGEVFECWHVVGKSGD